MVNYLLQYFYTKEYKHLHQELIQVLFLHHFSSLPFNDYSYDNLQTNQPQRNSFTNHIMVPLFGLTQIYDPNFRTLRIWITEFCDLYVLYMGYVLFSCYMQVETTLRILIFSNYFLSTHLERIKINNLCQLLQSKTLCSF